MEAARSGHQSLVGNNAGRVDGDRCPRGGGGRREQDWQASVEVAGGQPRISTQN